MVTVAHGTTQNASRPIHSVAYQGDGAWLIYFCETTEDRPAPFSTPSHLIVPLHDPKDVLGRPEFTGYSDLCRNFAVRFRVASGPNPRQPFWSAQKGIHVLQSVGMQNHTVCQTAHDYFGIGARSMMYEIGQGDPPFLNTAM